MTQHFYSWVCTPNRNGSLYPPKVTYENVYNHVIHNGSKLETIQVSIHSQMDK